MLQTEKMQTCYFFCTYMQNCNEYPDHQLVLSGRLVILSSNGNSFISCNGKLGQLTYRSEIFAELNIINKELFQKEIVLPFQLYGLTYNTRGYFESKEQNVCTCYKLNHTTRYSIDYSIKCAIC